LESFTRYAVIGFGEGDSRERHPLNPASQFFISLDPNQFGTLRVLIAADDHGFCDGASHERQDPYRHSPFDTSVFVLQTPKAARKWPTDPSLEVELRAAFRACRPSSTAVGRQLKHDAGARGAQAEQQRRKAKLVSRDVEEDDGKGGGAKGGRAKEPKKRRGPRMSPKQPGTRTPLDDATEAELTRWVTLKRKGDFCGADAIRAALAARGIVADKERPAKKAKPAPSS
jgi:phosphorylated CTD-interacting factor 1